jgi:sulfite reductase (ferredoxin)
MTRTWKEKLSGQIEPELGREIDIFETQLELRRRGTFDEKVFAETRLRRGIYGQRYDNGKRHDGIRTQSLNFPSGDLTKGPETMWDAPGMLRIKIPFGKVTPRQMEVLADVAGEYSHGVLHVTTRQDFQLHYIHIDDTPELMRRLASVGITTREACGNSVRNVTACPLAGICAGESFDVTPYAGALYRFLLGHPDCQDFGRKFKIAFSGCSKDACGLVKMHDLGAIARIRYEGGSQRRGFTLYLGGGLGAVPHQAKLYDDFLPEEELLPTAQAICRVFGRLGEKKNRARARIKFLVENLGIDKFRELVREERRILSDDHRWTSYLDEKPTWGETPLHEASATVANYTDSDYGEWRASNVFSQKQSGYAAATVTLPLGDLNSYQLRELAKLALRFVGENVRTTVDQNLILRWVPEADLPELYRKLKALGLGEHGASSLLDITSCPGTDTCKLGIAASRGLAAELEGRLRDLNEEDEEVKQLRIKISGCFNSCGQHHLADIGFFGNSRTLDGFKVPHFQVVLGGQWAGNAASFGMPIGAVPTKNIPEVLNRIITAFRNKRQASETFRAFVERAGKKQFRELIEDLMKLPRHATHPELYTDWGDVREFSLGDLGTGECAGEVVSQFQFLIADAEREVFEAQISHEQNQFVEADSLAYQGMVKAARALLKEQLQDISEHPDQVVPEFRARFYDTELFFDPYARGKFGRYLFQRHEQGPVGDNSESVQRLIEEAQLFIDAAHSCSARLREQDMLKN